LAVGAWTLVEWLVVQPGPFSISLAGQVEILGVARVVQTHLTIAAISVLSGAVAANVYWRGLRHRAARQTHAARREP
jgi:hypothetical protein